MAGEEDEVAAAAEVEAAVVVVEAVVQPVVQAEAVEVGILAGLAADLGPKGLAVVEVAEAATLVGSVLEVAEG